MTEYLTIYRACDTGEIMNVKYEPELHIQQVAFFIEIGCATDQEIADKMKIPRSTLSNWKKKFPDFKKAYDTAKIEYTEMQCAQVVTKLFQRCMGFSYEETEVITELTKTGKKKKNSRVRVSKKYSLPDVSAMKMFLYNRKKDEWAERQSLDISDSTDYDKQRKKIEQLFAEVSEEREKLNNGDAADEQGTHNNR